jgi:hypothetical protein
LEATKIEVRPPGRTFSYLLSTSFIMYQEESIRDLIHNMHLTREPHQYTIHAICQVTKSRILTAEWEVTISFRIPRVLWLGENKIFTNATNQPTQTVHTGPSKKVWKPRENRAPSEYLHTQKPTLSEKSTTIQHPQGAKYNKSGLSTSSTP